MPFESEKQRRWMHKNKPDMARRWEREEDTLEYKRKKKKKMRDELS